MKSGLTYQVGQLEKLGLVARRGCPTDDRSVFAVLTDAGRERLGSAAPDTSPPSATPSSTC
ncbi:MarR family winged helix-turn-helix transcriptional regulator [Yinghuangia aomiensis]